MTPAEIDQKLEASKTRLYEAHAKELTNRKCTKHIKDPYWVPSTMNNTAVVVKPKTRAPKTTDGITCKATKMDGNPCTAKAKPECDFCGRHNKKK